MKHPITKLLVMLFAFGLVASVHADEVVATLNGKKIMNEDLERYIRYREAVTQKKIDNKLAALHEYINREIMYQEALKKKADKDQKLQYMLNQHKYDLYIQSLLSQSDVAKPIEDAELQKVYDENIKNKTIKEFKLRHILLKKSESDAKAVIAELDKGENFEELAKQKSEGPSASAGGDIGWLNSGQMSSMPEFAQAVSEMKKGTYSKTPVKTSYGWHVIMLEDTRESEPPALDKVKKSLTAAIRQARMQEYVKGLRDKAKIDVKMK